MRSTSCDECIGGGSESLTLFPAFSIFQRHTVTLNEDAVSEGEDFLGLKPLLKQGSTVVFWHLLRNGAT